MRALLALLIASMAWAAPELDTRGLLESDLRLSLPGKDAPEGGEELQFLRLDNSANLAVKARSGDVAAFVDFTAIYTVFNEARTLEDLSTRETSDPVSFESQALYVQWSDFMAEGVELKVGRMVMEWGAADQFNPTSNLNPLDLEDPTKFGERLANQMVALSYTAPWTVDGDNITIFDEFTITGVVVPVHRPGQIPSSAGAVFTDPDLFAQFVNSPLLDSFVGLQKVFLERGGTFDYSTEVQTPGPALDNAQYAGRMSATVLGVDLSASYYRGYADALQAVKVDADLDTQLDVAGACGPAQAAQCGGFITQLAGEDLGNLDAVTELLATPGLEISGVIPTHIVLGYPKVHVVGFDATTSLDFLGGVGIWGEAAMTQHEDQDLILAAGAASTTETLLEEGSFWKLAAGLDYSFTSWWYLNAQYLHGFVDEFGADNLNDYVVAGSDLKFFNDQMTLRLFGIYQMQDQSYVVYPAIMNRFWDGAEVQLGAFWMGGAEDSKFGGAPAGQSRVFFKGKYSF